MKAKLICYTLGNVNHQIRSKFKREFFGYLDKSNKGNYKYYREGLISSIPNSRPIRSSIIIEKKNEEKIIEFLKKYNAEIKKYDIIIDENELQIPQDVTP